MYTQTESHCPDCHKPFIYIGDTPVEGWPHGLEPYCTCGSKDLKGTPVYSGWVCIKCNRSLSPWVSVCPCSIPPEEYRITC